MAEREPVGVDVQDDHPRLRFERNCATAKPIGPAPAIKTFSPGSKPARSTACAADAEGLDQGELIQRQNLGLVQLFDRRDDPFPHAAVDMDAETLEIDAAIRFAFSACDADPAVEIRLDREAVSRLDPALVRRDLLHHHAEFVTEDADS